MKLRFLGSGTIYPDPRRLCSSTAMEKADGAVLLVDCGPGTYLRLAQFKINLLNIRHIFLTHFHPDHIADLIPILFAIRNLPSKEAKSDIHISGTPGLRRFVDLMVQAYGDWLAPDKSGYRVFELKESEAVIEDFKVSLRKVPHNDESVGYRFTIDNLTVAFSGDSEYDEALVELMAGADAAIIECAYPDHDARRGHLTPSEVASIAKLAAPGRLLVNHCYPAVIKENPIDTIRLKFSGPVTLVHDGSTVDLTGDAGRPGGPDDGPG